jgi:hypothetical protein
MHDMREARIGGAKNVERHGFDSRPLLHLTILMGR